MFRKVPLSIIRTFSLCTQQWYRIGCEQDQDGTAIPFWSCSQAVSKLVWHIPLLCVQWKAPDDGQRNCPKHVNSFLILLASCQQTCMIYAIAVCTVKNSWWWTEELSETCNFRPNKFEKLVHLVGILIRITCIVYPLLSRPTKAQTYVLKYFVNIATCFRASAPFTGSLNFVLVKVANY